MPMIILMPLLNLCDKFETIGGGMKGNEIVKRVKLFGEYNG